MLTRLGVACLLMLCLASPSLAMEHYINMLQTRTGDAIGGVTVTVYQAGTLTKATLFSDNGVTAKSNPFSSDAYGYYDFYASNGVYDFTFVRSGFTFQEAFTRLALFDVNDGGGGGGGSSAFSGILAGTNNAAAMVLGTGSSLSFSGSGSVNASLFKGLSTIAVANGGTNLTAALDDNLMVGNGTTWESKALPTGCANVSTSKLLYNSATNAFLCGTDQGSSGGTFDTIGSGTNVLASMTVGTGASLTFSGSGTVNASSYRGNAVVAALDGGTGLTVPIDDTVLLGNGTVWQASALPSCSDPTNSKLLYNVATNAFSCGTDQSSGGGTTFNTIGAGTNTTAAMVVSTGASLAVTGTGAVTGTNFWPNVVTVNAGNSPYTALTTNATLLCDTSAAARIINLPAATVKTVLTFVNVGSNTCTINRAGADTITTGLSVGLTSFILRNAGSTFWLQPDGTSLWYVGG